MPPPNCPGDVWPGWGAGPGGCHVAHVIYTALCVQEMDIRRFFVSTKNLTEKSTDSVEAGAAAQESVDSVKGATPHSVLLSSSTLSGTFPSDLPVSVSVVHKQDILVKGPTQPCNCTFPRRKFSNGNLSFNPAWYDAKEAQGWLEYSIESDKMYCFVCRLFKSEVRERNESNWISIGICSWKKALEKIKKPLQKYPAQKC